MTATGRPFRRRILLNTASTGAANLWTIVVGLVSLPLILRGLGDAPFGSWVLLQTFSATTGWLSLADVGMSTSTTRAVAGSMAIDDRAGAGTSIGSSIAVFAVLGAAGGSALAIAGPAFLPGFFNTPAALRDDLRVAIMVFGAQVAVDLLGRGFSACLDGLQRVDLSRAVDALRRAIAAVGIATVALAGGGLRGVAVSSLGATVAGTALAGLVLMGTLRHAGPRHCSLTPSGAQMRALLAHGRTVALLGPLSVLHRTMDRVIAGTVFGPAAVTLVEISTQVQSCADAILSASGYAVVPSASWLHARKDRASMRELLEKGTRYSLLATLPAVAGAGVLSGPLVRVWLGEGQAEAAGLATVALLYVAMSAPVHVGSVLLLGIGRVGAILRAALVAVIVNLAASLVLVQMVGLVGVFLGTLLGTAFLVPLLARAFLSEVDLAPSTFVRLSVLPVLPAVVCLLVTAGIVVALPLDDPTTLALGTVFGGAAYLGCVLLTALPGGERRELRRWLRREHIREEWPGV